MAIRGEQEAQKIDVAHADWTADLVIKSSILEELAPFEQERYLRQLKIQGYTEKQITELRATIKSRS